MDSTTTDQVELEVDLRLGELLLKAWAVRDWNENVIAAYLRLTYATGYQDALLDRPRGQLFRDLGLPVPK